MQQVIRVCKEGINLASCLAYISDNSLLIQSCVKNQDNAPGGLQNGYSLRLNSQEQKHNFLQFIKCRSCFDQFCTSRFLFTRQEMIRVSLLLKTRCASCTLITSILSQENKQYDVVFLVSDICNFYS